MRARVKDEKEVKIEEEVNSIKKKMRSEEIVSRDVNLFMRSLIIEVKHEW